MPEQASEVDGDTRLAADIGETLDLAELAPEGNSKMRPPRDGDDALGIGWLTAAGLAEGGLLADVGIVLDLASIYLPLVGAILSFAVPTPFAILMLRRGTRVTPLASSVATFLITLIFDPHFYWMMSLRAH